MIDRNWDEEYQCVFPEVVRRTVDNKEATLLEWGSDTFVVSEGFLKFKVPRSEDEDYEELHIKLARIMVQLICDFPERISETRKRFEADKGISLILDDIFDTIDTAVDRHDERLRKQERIACAELAVSL